MKRLTLTVGLTDFELAAMQRHARDLTTYARKTNPLEPEWTLEQAVNAALHVGISAIRTAQRDTKGEPCTQST